MMRMLQRSATTSLFCFLASASRVQSFLSFPHSVKAATGVCSTCSFSSSSSSTTRSDSQGLADIGNSNNQDNNTMPTGDQSWRQLLEISSNRSRKIRGSNYVQLATVDPTDVTPRCRTVVFRGFVGNVPADHALAVHSCSNLPCIMKMITDVRSTKVQHIAANNAAEMVWWFPKTSQQYRIRGSLQLVGPDDDDDDQFLQTLRRETWGNLSDAAREAFYDESIPGAPWLADTAQQRLQIPAGARNATTGKVLQPPPDCFLLMLLIPNHCDYLQLGQEQYRQVDARNDQDGTWTWQRVNP